MTEKTEALRLADLLEERPHDALDFLPVKAAAELRRLSIENDALGLHLSERMKDLAKVEAQRDTLLEALKGMEARFGCESSRSETKPKTYSCRHMAEMCGNCYGLVTGWMAVQAARAAIKAVEGENT